MLYNYAIYSHETVAESLTNQQFDALVYITTHTGTPFPET